MMIWRLSRIRMGLLVISLILLTDAIAISQAIEFERLFSAAASKRFFFGRMSKGNSDDQASLSRSITKVCKDSDKKTAASTLLSRLPLGRRASYNQKEKEREQKCRSLYHECKLCVASEPSSSTFSPTTTCSALFSKQCSPTLEVRGGHTHSILSNSRDHLIPHHTPLGLPLYAWKLIFQLLLTAINVLCWYVPLIKHKSFQENELALSLANAFSGGVFLSLAFGHLIPECVAGFPKGYSETFPYMIVLGGYLLIFFVEKVAFDVHIHDTLHDHHVTPASNFINGSDLNGKHQAITTTTGNRSAIILLGALAIHSILEMVSLGLAHTFGDAALLSLSIGLHQPAESVALLVAFLKTGMKPRQIITYLAIFSAVGPLGVGLGMLLNEFATPLADAIMLAIVAGTFVYVGATEVIPEEWEDQSHKWKKFVSLITGIVTIYFVTQYTMSLH